MLSNSMLITGCRSGLLWLVAVFPTCIAAEELHLPAFAENQYIWKVVAGGHLAWRNVSSRYQRKLDTRDRVVDIGDPSSESGLRGLPLLDVEYTLFNNDFIDFEYAATAVETTAVAHRTVNFLFFPLRLASRVPTMIETENIRLRYTHLFVRRNDWELGGSIGVDKFTARLKYPNGAGGIQSDSTSSPLLNFGISSKGRLVQDVVLNARANFAPIYSQQNRGGIGDFNIALEYAIDSKMLIGAGYRYSKIHLKQDKDAYGGKFSYVTHGPMVFLGTFF